MILTESEAAEAQALAKTSEWEPMEVAKERFLYMILQAHKPGKMQMHETDRAEICKILTQARNERG